MLSHNWRENRDRNDRNNSQNQQAIQRSLEDDDQVSILNNLMNVKWYEEGQACRVLAPDPARKKYASDQ
jgi:hypothetical protein